VELFIVDNKISPSPIWHYKVNPSVFVHLYNPTNSIWFWHNSESTMWQPLAFKLINFKYICQSKH